MKQEWLNRSLLDSPVFYTLCLTPKAYRKTMKSLGVIPSSEFNLGRKHGAVVTFFDKPKSNQLCAVVQIKTLPGTELLQVYALLVHEAVHIWQEVKLAIGETRPGTEQEAYAVQRIAQSLMYSYKEQTEK